MYRYNHTWNTTKWFFKFLYFPMIFKIWFVLLPQVMPVVLTLSMLSVMLQWTEAYLEPGRWSKKELFAKKVNGFKPWVLKEPLANVTEYWNEDETLTFILEIKYWEEMVKTALSRTCVTLKWRYIASSSLIFHWDLESHKLGIIISYLKTIQKCFA